MMEFVNSQQASYTTTIPFSTTSDTAVYKLLSICQVNQDDPSTKTCSSTLNPIFKITDEWSDCEKPTCSIRKAEAGVVCSLSSELLSSEDKSSWIDSSDLTDNSFQFWLTSLLAGWFALADWLAGWQLAGWLVAGWPAG